MLIIYMVWHQYLTHQVTHFFFSLYSSTLFQEWIFPCQYHFTDSLHKPDPRDSCFLKGKHGVQIHKNFPTSSHLVTDYCHTPSLHTLCHSSTPTLHTFYSCIALLFLWTRAPMPVHLQDTHYIAHLSLGATTLPSPRALTEGARLHLKPHLSIPGCKASGHPPYVHLVLITHTSV